MQMHQLVAPAVLSVLLAVPAPAPPIQVRSQGLTVDELDPRVWCLHERENGELWFGTNGAGVFRWDGKTLTQYTKEHGLTGNAVRHLLGDGAGGVLVTANGGVSRFDGDVFTPLEVLEHSGAEGWRLDPADVWLVVDAGAGSVCRFDGEKVHQLELTESKAGGPARREGDPEWSDPAGVYHVARDRRGHVWIGTAGAGLCRYDGKSLAWMYEEPLTITPDGGSFGIRSIFQDAGGDFWVCNTRQRFEIALEAEGELLKYTAKEGLPRAAADAAENFTYFASILQDDKGVLWMTCGSRGLWSFDGREVTRHPLADGAYTLSVVRDSSGKIWVGTLDHGAFVSSGAGFERFRVPREG